MLKMFNKEKSEESERDKANQPIPWDSIMLRGAICLLFLVFIVGAIAFAIDHLIPKIPLKSEANFAQILLFSLGLVGASFTFAISLWRGEQIHEQIAGAVEQKFREREQAALAEAQSKQERLQNALELATEKENAARCISGLRALEGMYESLSDTDKESIYSVALYVLSLPKEGERKVSRTVRQWALDILIDKGFLSQESLHTRLRDKSNSMEMSVQKTMIEKDLSCLYFARKSKEKDSQGNKILNLSGFSFRDCDFHGANLSDVNFSNANFAGAKLFGTNISRTKFIDVDGFPLVHLGSAYCKDQPEIKIGDVATNKNLNSIQSWDDWKNLYRKVGEIVRKYDKAVEESKKGRAVILSIPSEVGLRDEMGLAAWDYLTSLAKEDAPYPPGEDHPEASKI